MIVSRALPDFAAGVTLLIIVIISVKPGSIKIACRKYSRTLHIDIGQEV